MYIKHLLVTVLVICAHCFISTAVADIKTHCQGKGKRVYLIGGGPAFTTWNLRPIQYKLGQSYRICRWDMRGVGDNASLNFKPGNSALSQWLSDMYMVLPQEPVILWGHSWGALQVLLFAEQYPQRVAAIILSNPVDPALHSLEHIELKRFNHPELEDRLRLEDVDTPVEKLHNLRSKIASYFADGARGWEYAAGFSQADANNALNVRIWNEYRQAPLTDVVIDKLSGKVSGVIYCKDDVLQPEALAEYRRLLPMHIHHVLTGCGHFPWEENPAGYYGALTGLLESVR